MKPTRERLSSVDHDTVGLDAGHQPVPLLLGSGWHADTPGGLNRYFADLFDALRHREVSLRATLIGPATGAPPGVHPTSTASQSLPVRLLRFWATAQRWRRDATVVDAHFALYAFLPVVVGRLRRLPLVIHFQGPWAAECAVSRGEPPQVIAIKRRLERAVYRRADAVVTLSAAFKRIVVEDYGVDPWVVDVVPPGVDLERFRPGDRDAARAALGVPTEVPVVATVRRLSPRMGLDVLIDAWAGVHDEIADGRLLIVGDGPERSSLEARVGRLGLGSSVSFLGRADDATLTACYRSADLTVVPTTALEGYGLVVLESLACGTPVVVTDAGGLPETVTGLEPATVVPAGDAAALADGIRRCLTDPPATPGRDRCRAHAETHGWDEVAARHLRIYAEAASRRRSPSAAHPRPRVVYLDHCARLSGGELALLALLPALDGVDAHVILGEEGPLVSRLLRRGISVEVLPMAADARQVTRHHVRPGSLPVRSVTTTLAYVLRLAKRLHTLRPDIVHTNSLKAALYGGVAARLAGVPVVWHVRDRIAPDYLPAVAVRLVRAMAGTVPHRIVANSRATLATVGPAGVGGRVIASPVRFTPGPAGRPAKGPEDPLRVGMIGRLTPWKGHEVFLEAFAKAFAGGPEEAVVVGAALFSDDEYAASLTSRATALGLDGRVVFRGFREDVMAELATMDIMVHASIVPEPFGRVVVEAMAAGVPVIAADAGGPAEIITSGVDGVLCPPGDVDALAASMRRLADDPGLRDRLQAAGRRRAEDFVPERVAREVMDVYRGLLEPRVGSAPRVAAEVQGVGRAD